MVVRQKSVFKFQRLSLKALQFRFIWLTGSNFNLLFVTTLYFTDRSPNLINILKELDGGLPKVLVQSLKIRFDRLTIEFFWLIGPNLNLLFVTTFVRIPDRLQLNYTIKPYNVSTK